LRGLERQGVAINFSTHILEAYEKAKQGADMGKSVVYEENEEFI